MVVSEMRMGGSFRSLRKAGQISPGLTSDFRSSNDSWSLMVFVYFPERCFAGSIWMLIGDLTMAPDVCHAYTDASFDHFSRGLPSILKPGNRRLLLFTPNRALSSTDLGSGSPDISSTAPQPRDSRYQQRATWEAGAQPSQACR
jgi:hypothetical protein